MQARLADRVAVVTGAGSGIGAAIARRLASEGAIVVLCGRRRAPLEEIARAIADAGGRAEAMPVDVADEHALAAAIRRVHTDHGRLDVVVQNAYQMTAAPLVEMTTEAWHHNFRVTLDAVFFGLRAALPLLAKAGAGSVINVSSTAGLAGSPALAGYGAAKAALENLTRTAAVEAAPHGVRVNSLCPGVIATPGTLAAFSDPRAARALARTIPLARFGLPEEVAGAAAFLASDDAAYVTGATLVVDGGQRAALGAPALDFETS
jgi:meso-butanediol dehydrogenase/(S,S)-butanediol dehydrogenase/diacetyl reductase